MKVLLPVDGSEYTKRMLAYLAAHDELLGPGHDFTALTVVTPLPSHVGRFLDHATMRDYYREEADKVLRPVQAFAAQQGWNIQVAHATGHPAEEIAAHATREKCDLIVMGTHGNSALGNVVLGSVVTGVLARCQVPLLLAR